MLGLAIVLTLIVVAIFAPVLAPYDPNAQILADRLQYFSWKHPFGTDDLGRDIFSRIIHGSRLTLYIVILVAVIAAPIGLLVGTTAGYLGGWVDKVLMRITDIFLAFPKLVLALALRRRPRPRHRERGHRHRHHLLAALRAHRPRRDAHDPQLRLHRGGAPAGRRAGCASSGRTSCRSAPPR
jgi:hypothetical protein